MYHDIAKDIIKNILSKKYEDKLPTETALMKSYHASRNTIRKAIDLVFAHGLLRRVQGSGYYIIERPVKSKKVLNMSIGFDQTAMVDGGPLKSKVVVFDKIKANQELAKQGRVDLNSELYRIWRLRYLQGKLYDLEEAYYPTSVVPYLPAESVEHSIFAFIRKEYHLKGSTTENYIQLTKLAKKEANLLKVNEGKSVLSLAGINYLKNGIVFNFSRTYFVYPDLVLYYHTMNIDSD
jgi:DNA-binding GntR family transcriptional regulator